VPTPVLFTLRPRLEGKVLVMQEELSFGIGLPSYEFQDSHGNITYRSMFMPGRNEIRHDALVAVSSLPDRREVQGSILPVGQLPSDLLRYTLPSRYCDSDKLMNFAWNHFGQITHGLPRVQTICDWVHNNIEYRFASGRTDLSASEVIERRYGVCRDFAHVAIALCRAFNLPARYVTGHLPDIGYLNPGTPMDFHAYCEVYLGQEWLTFDPRYNVPRIGRVKVAHGADAVDGAFATIYGEAKLTYFEVWAYQVNPREISVEDPIDLSKRLDGKERVQVPGLDGRTIDGVGYRISQRVRKRVEEIFGGDEDRGRNEAQSLSRSGTDASVGLFRGRDLQSASDNQSGTEFAGWMNNAIDLWVAHTGRKTRSKQPSGASTQ
jgi:transglutaminase-like putative cysteine protease